VSAATPRPARATSKAVADRAGVSRPTVSAILNGSADLFAQDTVRRVLQAAEDLGYEPSIIGRALVTGHSNVALLVLPRTRISEPLQQVIDELDDGLAPLGLLMILELARAGSTERIIEQMRPRVVIDVGGLSPALRQYSLDSGATVLPDFDGLADGIGATQAVYLRDRGHAASDYALVESAQDEVYGPIRFEAFRDHFEARGGQSVRSVRVPLDVELAAPVLRRHLDASPATAIACQNDDVAATVIAAAGRLGLSVPDRLAVIGADSSLISQVTVPPMTTVAVRVRELVAGVVAGVSGGAGQWSDQRASGQSMYSLVRRASA
jgi:DNA-binding LacI/PurR family transcriptional regulator